MMKATILHVRRHLNEAGILCLKEQNISDSGEQVQLHKKTVKELQELLNHSEYIELFGINLHKEKELYSAKVGRDQEIN
jgi:hypothetical protein